MTNFNENPVSPFGNQSAPVSQKKGDKKHSKRNYKSIALSLVAVAILGAGGYVYYTKEQQITQLQEQVAGTNTSSNKEFKEILTEVKKIFTIPEEESVRIALVDDPQLLIDENPTFYKDVQKGQYLVIMQTSQKVAIYDRTQNKIINFSSFALNFDTIDENTIAASEKPLNIEIRTQAGVDQTSIDKVKETLKKASANYKIVSVTQTNKTDYSGLTLVLLNKTGKPNMSKNLISHTGTTNVVDKLPDGENSSNADAVIIIGKIN
jgi:hypothetical protein